MMSTCPQLESVLDPGTDILTVTSSLPSLGISAVRRFRRVRAGLQQDKCRRHSVL